MSEMVEVTFLGFELEIVDRRPVQSPPPQVVLRPRPRHIQYWRIDTDVVSPAEPVDVYEYQGMGIYQRVR